MLIINVRHFHFVHNGSKQKENMSDVSPVFWFQGETEFEFHWY